MSTVTEEKFQIPGGIEIYGCWWGKETSNEGSPTLILLHEGLGCVAMWKEFPEKLHEVTQLPVFAFDRAGYGLSGDLPGGFTEGFLEKESDIHLPAILQAAGITSEIILIGHSDGATLALLSAINPAIKVIKVVTMAPHVIIEPVSVRGLLSTQKLAAETDFIARLQRYHGIRAESLVNGWLKAWLSPWGSVWQMDHYLRHIECPILFIQGTSDHFGSEAQAQHIGRMVKGPLQVIMIDHCGHIPYLQAQSVVLDAVSQFVK